MKLPSVQAEKISDARSRAGPIEGDSQGHAGHHSLRVATTTDVYMHGLPAGVRATVDAIHRELQGTMEKLAAKGQIRTPALAEATARVN